MKLLYWAQWPDFEDLAVALRAAFKECLLDRKSNERLFFQFKKWSVRVASYGSTAFWELLVNMRHLLPIRLALFKLKLKRERQKSIASGKKFNEYKFLLDYMNIGINYSEHEKLATSEIGPSAPLLIIANHSYPPIDALFILNYISERRADYSILSNSNNPLLSMFEGHEDKVIELHSTTGPLATGNSTEVNRSRLSAMKQMMRRLKNGECVIIFPAGEGSKAESWGEVIEDVEWLDGLGFVVERTNKTNLHLQILPILFEGHLGTDYNSHKYHSALLDHPNRLPAALQYALLNPPQLQTVHLGEPISANTLTGKTRQEITQALREAVYGQSSLPLPIATPLAA